MKTNQSPPLSTKSVNPSLKRIGFVLHECMGPTQNNGLGVAYTLLAETLAGNGHAVTILFATTKCTNQTLDYWATHYRKKSIEFIVLPAAKSTLPEWLIYPHAVYNWLKYKNFDVIHYPEYPGNGYLLALAKRYGLAFQNTTLCVGIHGPSMWSRKANGYTINAVRHLAVDFMERQTAALSDVLISPSHHMIQWMQHQGWTLPTRHEVLQNIAPPVPQKPPSTMPPNEIVFFGRIEPRKGYRLLCDALDLLPPDVMHGITVTFLGSSTKLYTGESADEVRQRSEKWACTTNILTDKTHDEALSYLCNRSCFAVIPPNDDNLPYTVMECIAAKIPFIASHAGGIPELIAPTDWGRVCFDPHDAKSLAALLRQVLQNGMQPAQAANPHADNKKKWIDWHKNLSTLPPAQHKSPNVDILDLMPAKLQHLISLGAKGGKPW